MLMKRERRERVSRGLEVIFGRTVVDVYEDLDEYEVFVSNGDFEWDVSCLSWADDYGSGRCWIRKQFFKGICIWFDSVEDVGGE